MMRIVRDPDGRIVFDVDRRLPGRGAYVCPDPSCLGKLSSSSLARHLRAPVILEGKEELLSGLAAAMRNKVRNLLTIGLKAGQVRLGTLAVEEALKARRVALIILASDVAGRTEHRLLKKASEVPVRRVATKKRLGEWMGRSSVGAAVLTSEGLGGKLLVHLDRLTSIEDSPYHAGQPYSHRRF